MRAVGVTEYGGPERLHEIDLPAQPLRSGTVRMQVTAAAVNPADTVVRIGTRKRGERPAGQADVPGMDVAGVLREIGEDTHTDLVAGDRVMGIVLPRGTHGGYREDIVLPIGSVALAPADASDTEAATLPMNGLTAQQTLDLLALAPGQVLAVTGAAGTYGGYLIQLAKLAGLTVIADAAARDDALVRSAGADIVVGRGEDVAERMREHFPDGVDAVADASVQQDAVLAAVRDGGALATLRTYRGAEQQRVRICPVLVGNYAGESAKLHRLGRLVEDGVLTLRVADTLPPGEAAEAHRRLAAGGVRGRMVLDFR